MTKGWLLAKGIDTNLSAFPVVKHLYYYRGRENREFFDHLI